MATMCVTPAVFTATEPDPTAQAFAKLLADYERLTDKNKAWLVPHLQSLVDSRLASQGDPVAVSAKEARDQESAAWWAAELKKKDKEKAKMAPKIAAVKRAKQCAYEVVLAALEGTEAEDAMHDESTLTFYLETLEHPDRYDTSRIRGFKAYMKRLVKAWNDKADVTPPFTPLALRAKAATAAPQDIELPDRESWQGLSLKAKLKIFEIYNADLAARISQPTKATGQS